MCASILEGEVLQSTVKTQQQLLSSSRFLTVPLPPDASFGVCVEDLTRTGLQRPHVQWNLATQLSCRRVRQ